ncbi:family 16 glycoside hydrolase [Aquisphaera insulae]|uniref:family 16 glycoside hydrolase n=1 Tax=Aquisphaera insulae TaxID=2712864 RepID=UPI00202FD399|nr:family 16 glycoside hydrolase [Aquisphaera insulae]
MADHRRRIPRIGSLGLMAALGGLAFAAADDPGVPGVTAPRWKQHDIHRPRPQVVDPGPAPAAPIAPPGDAVILFDGKSLDAWETPDGKPAGWKVSDGAMEIVPGTGAIRTRASFGDVQLHVEWASPSPARGVGQDRGNSGIFLMGQFEVQVIDSYKADTYADGMAGAIYGQYSPLANATRPPGEWQVYDIAFRRPRFDASGKLVRPAGLTVFLNGVLVQNNEEPWGPTSWLEPSPNDPTLKKGPIELQDHSHPVRYRNIWIREIPERSSPPPARAGIPVAVGLSDRVLDGYVGAYSTGSNPGELAWKISRDGDHLLLKLPFKPVPLQLIPVSESVFVLPHTDAELTFRKDDQGRVTGLFRVGDGERPLTRQ